MQRWAWAERAFHPILGGVAAVLRRAHGLLHPEVLLRATSPVSGDWKKPEMDLQHPDRNVSNR
jgi:hypothetical protein